MHELGMCAGVVDAIERRAGGRAVDRVGVRVGVLHRVVPEAFEQAFGMAAAGTVAEGASVELDLAPVGGRCRPCGAAFSSRDPTPACPDCGSIDIARDGGDELILEWVRYRGPHEAPVAGGP